jgi:hypothetical protein
MTVIGQLIRLYCEGRRDALAGAKRSRIRSESDGNRAVYLTGYRDERRRMRARQQLDQMRLEFTTEVET